MKKTAISLLAIAFLATSVFAAAGRFQIFVDKGSGLGWGKRTIMLDTETGKTWRLDGKKWQILQRGETPIVLPTMPSKESSAFKTTATIQAQPVDLSVKIKLAEELAAAKKKHAAELKALKLKLDEKEKAKAAKKAKAAGTTPAENSDSEEAPPAWLSE